MSSSELTVWGGTQCSEFILIDLSRRDIPCDLLVVRLGQISFVIMSVWPDTFVHASFVLLYVGDVVVMGRILT